MADWGNRGNIYIAAKITLHARSEAVTLFKSWVGLVGLSNCPVEPARLRSDVTLSSYIMKPAT